MGRQIYQMIGGLGFALVMAGIGAGGCGPANDAPELDPDLQWIAALGDHDCNGECAERPYWTGLEACGQICIEPDAARVSFTVGFGTTGPAIGTDLVLLVNGRRVVPIGRLEWGDFYEYECGHIATFDFDLVLPNGEHTIVACAMPDEDAVCGIERSCSDPVVIHVACGPTGCTRTQGFWKNHPDAWPIAPERVQICDRYGLDILKTPPRGEAWYILAHQYIAAMLNVADGASTDGLSDALQLAHRLLANTCEGISRDDRGLAIRLAEYLDDFNNGHEGVPHCD